MCQGAACCRVLLLIDGRFFADAAPDHELCTTTTTSTPLFKRLFERWINRGVLRWSMQQNMDCSRCIDRTTHRRRRRRSRRPSFRTEARPACHRTRGNQGHFLMRERSGQNPRFFGPFHWRTVYICCMGRGGAAPRSKRAPSPAPPSGSALAEHVSAYSCSRDHPWGLQL